MLRYLFFLIASFAIISGCIPPKEKEPEKVKVDFSDKNLQKIYDFQDKQLTDSLFRYFKAESPTYRYISALAFGSIKDEKAIDSLVMLLKDENERVRVAAAYALGQIGDRNAEEALIKAFDKSDSLGVFKHANAAILEAIGKCGSNKYLSALSTIASYSNTDTILLEGQAYGIYRYAMRDVVLPDGTKKMVEFVTGEYPLSVRIIAANYLFRAKALKLEDYANDLIDIFKNENDVRIKPALAIAIGKTKSKDALSALLEEFQKENDYRVKVNIIRAFGNFDYEEVNNVVFEALKNKNLHIAMAASQYLLDFGIPQNAYLYRRMALDVDLPWQVQITLFGATNKYVRYGDSIVLNSSNYRLRRRFEKSENPYEKAAALKALAEYGWNYPYIRKFGFSSDEPVIRSAAMEAFEKIANKENFNRFFGKGSWSVIKKLSDYMVEAFENGDPGMMASAAGILRTPSIDFKNVLDSLDFLEEGLKTLELPKEIETYNEIKETIDYFNGITESKQLKPEFSHPIDWIKVGNLSETTKATIFTNKGKIVLKFMPEFAPATCVNFIDLAREDFYLGKIFHRIVSNFVIQGGCPRGDGYGSLNYTIRSELPYLHYDDEGYVGMASSGNHTECTQFFITHSPTLHLDGNYTIFAKVIEGMDVVHNIEIGDKIEKILIED